MPPASGGRGEDDWAIQCNRRYPPRHAHAHVHACARPSPLRGSRSAVWPRRAAPAAATAAPHQDVGDWEKHWLHFTGDTAAPNGYFRYHCSLKSSPTREAFKIAFVNNIYCFSGSKTLLAAVADNNRYKNKLDFQCKTNFGVKDIIPECYSFVMVY